MNPIAKKYFSIVDHMIKCAWSINVTKLNIDAKAKTKMREFFLPNPFLSIINIAVTEPNKSLPQEINN